MRSPLLMVAIALIAACSPADEPLRAPAMFRGDAAHTGVARAQGPSDPSGALWEFRTAGPVRSSPTVAGGLLYVGSTDGRMYALERATGAERWRVDVGSPIGSSPTVARGFVIFGSRDGRFHALDARSGAVRWEFSTGTLVPWPWGFEGWDIYTSSPAVHDDVAVFGAGDGVLYALDLPSGRERWRFATEGRIRSSPAIADGTVFVGSADGRVYAVDLATGRERWRHATEGAALVSADLGVDRRSIIASPSVVDGTVYIGSRDGYMYALDQTTGTLRWRASHEGSWAISSPAVLGDTVYSGTSDGRWVHAVAAQTGEELWRHTASGYTWSSPTVTATTLYIGDGGGALLAIDRLSGEERWRFPVNGGVYSSPAVADGVVYFGSDDGSVYALHERGDVSHRAVFWDEGLVDRTFFDAHAETRAYFALHGYRVLDAEALGGFLQARIDDRTASVVVFAMDDLPPSIAPAPADTVLLRRYLAAGGKVVWLGLPPMLLVWNGDGRVTGIERERPAALLGIDYASVNFDFYATAPTEEGRRWGLARGWVSSYAVEPGDGITVLGIDETERAGAWVKSFGGPPGTGFVGFSARDVSLEYLDALRRVAEYGVVERG